MKLIDVSYHNGNIDFSKVKADGIEGVIIRAGYGNGNIDKKFAEYISACNRIGLPVGIYWFSYAYSVGMARQEAEYCINVIKPYKVDLPVFFDWEYDSMNYAKRNGVAPGKALISQMNKAFCQRIEKAGYKAGYYFNADYERNYIDTSAVGDYITWFARYASAPGYGCDLWQYTSSGTVAGITGSVDVDKVINKAVFTVDKGSGSSASVAVADPKGTTLELAVEVMEDVFGSGEQRKKALGRRYDEVQDFINHIATADLETLVKETLEGKYGNGETRMIVLGGRYNKVQQAINNYYMVQKGDTLTSIAREYDTTLKKLKKMNGIASASDIKAGQIIKVK